MSSGLSTPAEGPGSNSKSSATESPKHTLADAATAPSDNAHKEDPERESSPEEGEEDEDYEEGGGGEGEEEEEEEGEEDEEDEDEGRGDGEEAEAKDGQQPPLPPEAPPDNDGTDDGWQPIWDDIYQAYYFYNSVTNETTWTNPRVPTADSTFAGEPPLPLEDEPDTNLTYNPAIHGDYDPSAPYAQPPAAVAPGDEYVSRGAFNRFTGKFQPSSSRRVPETYNDENKTRRQMEFYFDVDAAASTHDGRSLKAERQTRKLSRKEVKQFQEKRKARKEEKRKAWLRD